MTVDDSPVIAERLQFMLSEIDSVEFLGNAFNIPTALHLIDQRTPNVVILDIHLKDDLTGSQRCAFTHSIEKKDLKRNIIMLYQCLQCHNTGVRVWHLVPITSSIKPLTLRRFRIR